MPSSTFDLVQPGVRDDSSVALDGLAQRITDLPRSAVAVYDIDHVDASALPHLLEQFSVDFVKPDLTEAQKRALIKGSIPWHRIKGTDGALKDVTESLLGVRPEIRHKRYFIAGWSRAGVDPAHNPPAQFEPDIVFDSDAAAAAGILRKDAQAITDAVYRGSAQPTVRFQRFIAGSWEYGLAGIDLA